jgi:hypothetical protein
MGSQSFNNNEELTEGVKTWLSSRAADFWQAYKNLFPHMTSASIPTVTTLRSSLSMDIFLVNNKFLFLSLPVLLTAHRRLLSKYP